MNSAALTTYMRRYAGELYFGVLLLYIIEQLFSIHSMQVFTKPMLMLTLLLMVLQLPKNTNGKLLITFALFFSLAGDCFLLFENKYPALFIPGLISFLITHILYIFYFNSCPIKGRALVKIFCLLIVLCILYGSVFLFLLYPGLGPLKLPVSIYAVIILIMLLSALYAYTSLPVIIGQHFVMGALLFVFSDSLLALNKFLFSLGPFAIAIIITYAFAQWFIVCGYIKTQG